MSEGFVELIDRGIELAPARLLDVEGFTHIDKDNTVTVFKPPVPVAIEVHTLTGFVALLEQGFEGFDPAACLIHVEAFNEVELIAKSSDKHGRRQTYVRSTPLKPDREFKFNTFIPQEDFNIALRTMFTETPELNDLVKLAGNIALKAEVGQEDDGFSQSVTAKAGVHMVGTVVVKPRVTLKPIRTFLEVEQPDGDFIFRVKHDPSAGNTCALFEADGGRWRLAAMSIISKWLSQYVSTSQVDAINNIPVIA